MSAPKRSTFIPAHQEAADVYALQYPWAEEPARVMRARQRRYEAHMAMQARLRQDEDDERKYGRSIGGED